MASIIHCGVVCNTLLETACLISQKGHWHGHTKFHEMREDLVFNTTENVPSKWTPMSSSQNPTKCLQYHKSLHCLSSCPHQTPPKSKRVLCVERASSKVVHSRRLLNVPTAFLLSPKDTYSWILLFEIAQIQLTTEDSSKAQLVIPKYSWSSTHRSPRQRVDGSQPSLFLTPNSACLGPSCPPLGLLGLGIFLPSELLWVVMTGPGT